MDTRHPPPHAVGYGDITASPANAAELCIAALLMLLSGFVWADVVAGFVTVITNIDPDQNEFRMCAASRP